MAGVGVGSYGEVGEGSPARCCGADGLDSAAPAVSGFAGAGARPATAHHVTAATSPAAVRPVSTGMRRQSGARRRGRNDPER
ncbi:hypothetical protein [Nonomuraea mesophila]|uniref:hypothetical protein n=1 Tax=Nonomuraea mesophila TaxID=2530382 RepID=UPI001047251D|nr:hypothetical protein [Nonomuraea mesophila]